jgi:hypothetical protein
MKMSELVTTIAKIEIAPKQKYLVLEVRHVTRLLHASYTPLTRTSYTPLTHTSYAPLTRTFYTHLTNSLLYSN